MNAEGNEKKNLYTHILININKSCDYQILPKRPQKNERKKERTTTAEKYILYLMKQKSGDKNGREKEEENKRNDNVNDEN